MVMAIRSRYLWAQHTIVTAQDTGTRRIGS